MELKLNIYEDNDKVIKTYTKNGYRIKMKLLKRFICVLDLNKIADLLNAEDSVEDNNKFIAEIGTMINNSYELIKDLTLSVFPDMKEDEFENVAINELAVLVINLVKFTIGTVGIAQTEKKLEGGSSSATTLYENIVELEIDLSREFKSLNPLIIDEYEAVHFFTLIRDYNNYTARRNKKENINMPKNQKQEGKRVYIKIDN